MNKMKEQYLHEIAANFIVGNSIDIDIKGSEIQLECFEQLLKTSRRLKVLLDEGNNFNEIKLVLNEKKNLTRRFQNLTGITWKL
tara:strand:- start:30 stop:281 length:252 start_codon:yes stop_codon:yes gene_type:complete